LPISDCRLNRTNAKVRLAGPQSEIDDRKSVMPVRTLRQSALPRSIGVWGASAISIGVMIGSGIFRTPADIAKELDNPLLILALWAGGGILCLFGALTYAELGTMFPKSGGIYVFLHEGFGAGVAFVFGWTYLLITQPMAVAAIATVFSEHVNQLLGAHADKRIITCGLILILTAINVRGMRPGAGLAVILTGCKTLALVLIVAAALLLRKGDAAHFVPGAGGANLGTIVAAVAPVLAAILWTYDGWSDTVGVAEEIREPDKRILRVLLLSTVGTGLLYVAVNAVYIWMIPLETMRGTPTVAPLVMERLVGPAAGTAVTLLVLLSTAGAAHGSIIVGARVTFAQARDRLMLAFPGRVHPKFQSPAAALWTQALLACLAAIVLARFEKLMGGFVFTMWIFYGMSAAAIFVLRIRRPDQARPYRCWGYPLVPALFVLSSAGMTGLLIRESPRNTLPWLGVLLAGAPVYLLWRRLNRPNP